MRRCWLLFSATILAIAGVPGLVGLAAGPAAASPAAVASHAQAGSPARTAGTARTAGLAAAARHRPRTLLVCNDTSPVDPCPTLVTREPEFRTVQGAVNAARRGDWILIWPGVYHENSRRWPAGVWISTPDLHIRGLDRNKVIIDGSRGSARHPCPSSPRLQNYAARDGIVVWKASGVTIQNLTVCDYLSGRSGHGNEIWWDGGDGSGRIGMGSYSGSYLTATSMYHPRNIHSGHLAQYGIFVSNASGPGLITRSYASNMADAAYYVGACQRRCDTVLSSDTGVNSNLGYSGTNAGGRLVIRNSRFERNRAGIVPNSLNNDDAPPPQDGRCRRSATRSCMLIEDNLIADNNNPDVPTSGITPAVGAGVEISGGAYDTVRDNVILGQGSWGVVTHDYPDTEKPPAGSHCQGGIQQGPLCLFPARGNRVYGNYFSRDGFFGNATNGDLATESLSAKTAVPRNCFYGNRAVRGRLTSAPAHIQRAGVDGRPCGKMGTGNDPALLAQLFCATGFGSCTSGMHYPKQTKIVIAPLPRLATMQHPCRGVPRNGFC